MVRKPGRKEQEKLFNVARRIVARRKNIRALLAKVEKGTGIDTDITKQCEILIEKMSLTDSSL